MGKLKEYLYRRKVKTLKWFELRIKPVRARIYAEMPTSMFEIPIIINNFNQLDYLKRLIDSLVTRGYKNIHIIDNASSYPPLLEYYENCPWTVYRLKDNLGYLAFWKSGLYKKFFNKYFVYTDPDVVLVDECPADFMERFYNLLQKYKYSSKVGFSLKIDDLPDHYPNKKKVVEWEEQYWQDEIEPDVYRAPIDTTFALYRPFTKNTRDPIDNILRVGFPYQLRHLPWYVDPKAMTDNEKYYVSACNAPTHWGDKIKSEG